MPSPNYVHEKTRLTLEYMAGGEADFEERLKQAWAFNLSLLNTNDSTADVADDLNWLLTWCRHWVDSDYPPVMLEDRHKVTRCLIRLVIATAREDD